MNNFDISDSRLYDYLAEKAEQTEPEDDFYDEAMDFAMELEADLHDRDWTQGAGSSKAETAQQKRPADDSR